MDRAYKFDCLQEFIGQPYLALREIQRLRAENDKANKGLERAGEIETTLRSALREAEGRLAESRARAARLEAKGQDLRDSLVKIRCADCAEHGYAAEKMDCPVCAEGMRRIWDWYAALAPGTALEAVRGAVSEWDVYVNDFQNVLPHGKLIDAMKHLRAAFGLAGEGGER